MAGFLRSRTRRLESLSDSDAQRVEWLTGTLTTAWQYPKLDTEAKLMLTDDVAGLFTTFGYETVESAIDWHRQRAERSRPAIGAIRLQCEAHRPQRKRPDGDMEHERFMLDVRRHPERYIPVSYCMRDGQMLTAWKAAQKTPPSEAAIDQKREELKRASQKEWAAEIAKAKRSGTMSSVISKEAAAVRES